MFRGLISVFSWLFSIGFTLLVIGGIVGVMLFNHFSRDLPDHAKLAQYDPPTVTRLYASDGRLMEEYATERRVFVPLPAIPMLVRKAFLSAEDKNFYTHSGIDITGIVRAVRDNIIYYGQGKSLVGGSTITQQVVKNFLLSNEKSIERKIKEAILAMRISEVYSKDKILELYLNEIYLGGRSYGVAAAALNYFNKSLDDLTIEEAALLAALPKAPSAFDPRRNPERAKERRDWVITRMIEDGFIDPGEGQAALEKEIVLQRRAPEQIYKAEFFAEEVRRWLKDKYGESILYEGGLVVKTTLDPKMQDFADTSLRDALITYDRRRGYRGPMAKLDSLDDWKKKLIELESKNSYQILGAQRLAVVMSVNNNEADITFSDGTQGHIPHALLKWTRRVIADGVLGPEIKTPGDVVRPLDVVLVAPASDEQVKELKKKDREQSYDLQQIPEVNGAMVVMDPHTGRVLAMTGGYSYGGSEFNRATQAKRQPGSAFKPFVYMAALENGFSPSTLLLDGPVEVAQGPGLPNWRPQNYSADFLGPITMRRALEKSRNTVTVRIAQIIGLDKVMEMGERLGIYEHLKPHFSMVLGAKETTLLALGNAYSMIVNGGKQIAPSMIERIDDRHGTTIYRRDSRTCATCQYQSVDELPSEEAPPEISDDREQVIDPRIAYQMTSMLEGVAMRGTAARAYATLKRPLGGKTGTTNDSRDVWFMGFSPDLVAGVYVGFDNPRTLGKRETGSSTALPAFIEFMQSALKDTLPTPFRTPPGIQLVRVDEETGLQMDGSFEPVGKVTTETLITGDPVFVPGREPGDVQTTPVTTTIDTEVVLPSVDEVSEGASGLY